MFEDVWKQKQPFEARARTCVCVHNAFEISNEKHRPIAFAQFNWSTNAIDQPIDFGDRCKYGLALGCKVVYSCLQSQVMVMFVLLNKRQYTREYSVTNRMEMDQNVAQVLLTQGATLILLDVPVGTDVGIDLKSWNTGDNFKGIKMIPPGVHLVHYR